MICKSMSDPEFFLIEYINILLSISSKYCIINKINDVDLNKNCAPIDIFLAKFVRTTMM